MDVAVHWGSGHASPRFPCSKARPDSKHVAVSSAVGRAPPSSVFDEARALLQFFSFPCGAIPFEGFSSTAAVPRHRDLCPHVRPMPQPHCRVATTEELGAPDGPQGLAPLSSSLPTPMLPSRAARSFPGLAYRQDFSAISRLRNSLLVLTECRVRRVGGPCRSRGDPKGHAQRVLGRAAGATRIGPARDPCRRAEALDIGQHHRHSKTNLRALAEASSRARRRGDSGAPDAFPSSPTGTRDHRPSPGTG